MRVLAFGMPASLRDAPPSLLIAGWLLRIAVLGHAIGTTTAIFTKLGSGMGTYFFLEWGFTHPQVAPIERMGAYLLLGLAVGAFLRPNALFLMPIALMVIFDAWAHNFNAGFPFAEWVVGAHALRFLAPLALLLLCFAPLGAWIGPRNQLRASAWALRIAIATVFLVHGAEAWLQHPRFVDYILMTTHNYTGVYMAEATAGTLLRVIGVVDTAVALAVLVRPHPAILGWMALWGLVTALSRVTSFGPAHHYEVWLRTAHFLAPLALLCMMRAVPTGVTKSRPAPRESHSAQHKVIPHAG